MEQHDSGTAEALRVVEDVASDAVEDGRARIVVEPSEDGVVGGLRICLIPANARACVISLTADHPPHIDLFLGLEPTITSYEFWRDDFAENLSLLRERLEAVVAGRYEQTIETHKRNGIEVTSRFDLPGGVETYKEATRASAAVQPGEKYTLRFEAY